jgi:hypothetical protein
MRGSLPPLRRKLPPHGRLIERGAPVLPVSPGSTLATMLRAVAAIRREQSTRHRRAEFVSLVTSIVTVFKPSLAYRRNTPSPSVSG